jgi:hypothetical protein
MVIEVHGDAYVIRRAGEHFLCFVDDISTSWIGSPYMARHFAAKVQAQEVIDEIRKRGRSRIEKERQSNLFLSETL